MRVKGLKCNLSEDMPCTLLVVGEIIGSKQFTVFADIGAGKLWSTRNKPLPVQLNLRFAGSTMSALLAGNRAHTRRRGDSHIRGTGMLVDPPEGVEILEFCLIHCLRVESQNFYPHKYRSGFCEKKYLNRNY